MKDEPKAQFHYDTALLSHFQSGLVLLLLSVVTMHIYTIYGSIFKCVFKLAHYHIENGSLGFLEYYTTQLREACEKHPALHTLL